MVATSILGHIFEGINGDSVYRGASFLAGKLGEKIAGEHVTVIDDGTMVGGFGTAPFDGEGIPTRRTVVIEKGVLKSYLLNTYTAKKLGLQTTGNASRGLAGTPGIGPGNYFLRAGQEDAERNHCRHSRGTLRHRISRPRRQPGYRRLFPRRIRPMDFGGELTYPVEEITVAGNLKEMFFNISEIASDLEFRGAMACPTIRIDGLIVGGE